MSIRSVCVFVGAQIIWLQHDETKLIFFQLIHINTIQHSSLIRCHCFTSIVCLPSSKLVINYSCRHIASMECRGCRAAPSTHQIMSGGVMPDRLRVSHRLWQPDWCCLRTFSSNRLYRSESLCSTSSNGINMQPLWRPTHQRIHKSWHIYKIVFTKSHL